MTIQTTSPEPAPLTGIFPKERLAVALLFLANGLYIGAWSPKIPVIARSFALSEQLLGLLLVAFGVGSIAIMPIAGAQIARFGSSLVVKVAAILFLPVMLFITFAPNVYLLAVAVFLFGGFAGAMDIAMNANAVEVEKRMRRSIMSSCHAYWSMGALVGAAIGGFLIDRFGAETHAIIATALDAALVFTALAIVMHDGPHDAASHGHEPRTSIFQSPLPWLLGIMALFSMLQEGLVIDWSSLYLSTELGSTLTIASFAAAAFHGTMMLMRFAGDSVRDRFGAVRTFRISAVLALVGMIVGGLAPNAYVAIVGFAVSGLGVSNLVPIAFSAAGNLPGMAKGVGLSVVTAMGYSGTLFAPTLFGFVIAHTGFQAIYLGAPLLLLVVLALSHLAAHADGIKGGGH
ncbi:MFS transporter [Rhizobium alvei]|uniref:MFS transporter n=1 Tax=Rhizobium alvei TaxID=1132659 RepID=A0ABT8YTK0_9HYPH|nr:MFS transporter [Rhizobium alvei]MDO6967069.1 MFS transporter [Rhizobium alvei]